MDNLSNVTEWSSREHPNLHRENVLTSESPKSKKAEENASALELLAYSYLLFTLILPEVAQSYILPCFIKLLIPDIDIILMPFLDKNVHGVKNNRGKVRTDFNSWSSRIPLSYMVSHNHDSTHQLH